jgi:hypothetical protein
MHNAETPSRDSESSPLVLIPTPREVRRLGGAVLWDGTVRVVGLTGTKGPEHHRLIVGDGGVVIEAETLAGERAARATLGQLTRQFGARLPKVEIEDWPAFATRGVMLDVSRCRVPRMDEFAGIVETLAGLKINHLQIYTEHTFAYTGAEEVWRGWSPMTAAEVGRLDAICRDRGIELAANQNCFGHLRNWLESPKYRHLAETHGDWMFDVWPRSGPFSLCPTDPASGRFVEGLLAELMPCFSSGLINIGCDETFDVGWGRSKEAVAARGRAAVYLEFVRTIAGIAERHGKRPMFWADIALSHPECVKDIPENLIALAWGYEPDSPFETWCEQLAAAGRETWVCPGTSSWRSITGRTTERHANLATASQAGVRHGVKGMLVTDWGDTGHWQQWPIAIHAIAHGAHTAWTGDAATFDPGAAAVHGLGVPVEAAGLGAWLERLGDADLGLRRVCLPLSREPKPGEVPVLRNQTALMIDLFKGIEEQRGVGTEWQWYNAHETIQRLTAEFERDLMGLVPSLIADEIVHTLDFAGFAAVRGWCRRLAPEDRPLSRSELIEWLDELTFEHRRLWKIRSRSGGLDQSCAFFAQVREKTQGTSHRERSGLR